MPKENVNDHVSKGFRVEVSWSPGAYVQMASVNQASDLMLPGEEPGAPEQPFTGWWVTLDRDGINRLIRSLRKARDAAFGRDE